MNAVPEATKVW